MQQLDPQTAPARKTRRRITIFVVSLLVLGFVGINAIAFMQAWSMTHFVPGGDRTQPPEHLSLPAKLRVLLTGVHTPRPENLTTPTDFHLASQTRHIPSGQYTLETWFIPATENPHGLILMYHGFVASKDSLLPAASEFHELNYSVELVDFHGSGGSTGNTTTIGYREAEDILATVADARKNLLAPTEPLILFGQSMGTAAILRAVGDLKIPGPSINALILESPYDRLLSTASNRFHSMHLPAFPLARLLIFWGGAQQGYWGFNMNPTEFASEIHCPVLMFHGQLDTRVSTQQATDVYNHLQGPKSLELYPSAGHLAFLSSDPTRWRSAVSKFLTHPTQSAKR